MTTTMMIFSMMSKMIRLSTRIAVWTQHHEQYHRQQAQLRTRPTKASAGWGCTAHHNNETTGGRGRAPPQAPPHRGAGGDTMGWGGRGGVAALHHIWSGAPRVPPLPPPWSMVQDATPAPLLPPVGGVWGPSSPCGVVVGFWA